MAYIRALEAMVTDINQNSISVSYTSDKNLNDVKLSVDNGTTYRDKISMTSNSALFSIEGIENGIYDCKLKGFYEEEFKIHFIDAGTTGDCILIQTENDKTILIDSNYKSVSSKVIDYIKSQNVTKLDYIIATHHHTDHTEGMPNIINAFDVTGAIAYNRTPNWSNMPAIETEWKTKESHDAFVSACNSKGIQIVTPTEKQRINVSENTYFEFYNTANTQYGDYNNLSLVVMLVHGKNKFLFSGDIAKSAQESLLNSNLKADILKVNHHDIEKLYSDDFFDMVGAKAAIITNPTKFSDGKPRGASGYYQYNYIPYYGQYDNGTIVITSYGDSYKINSKVKSLYKNAWWDWNSTGKWYYFKNDGNPAKNESLKIGGKIYEFGPTGLCLNP